MTRATLALLTVLLMGTVPLSAADFNWIHGEPACLHVVESMKLPVKLAPSEKPARVDTILRKLSYQLQGKSCAFKFSQVFRPADLEFLPLTNVVVGLAPESSLENLALHGSEGTLKGRFERRVTVELEGRTTVTNPYPFYYFHFRDGNSQIQSTGNRLLRDDFLAKWSDLADRIAISTRER